MRRGNFAFILLIILICSSCSYEEKRRTETLVEQAVDQFHVQLNEANYQEIYSQADADLRAHVNEADFIAQLSAVHEQVGKTNGKAIVIIDDSLWRGVRQAFGAKRELIPYGSLLGGETGIGQEKFVWAIENNQVKLSFYNFRFICKKPCTIGFSLK